MYGKTGDKNPMYGRRHSESAKQKMSTVKRERCIMRRIAKSSDLKLVAVEVIS